MDLREALPGFQVNQMKVYSTETTLRDKGTVEEWCLKCGTMMGHADHVAAKVARMITIGSSQNPPLLPDIQQTVPQATRGSWWILFASEDSCDVETYRRLANYAMAFRGDVWGPDRQRKFAKHTLEKIEQEIRTYRLNLLFPGHEMDNAEFTTTTGCAQLGQSRESPLRPPSMCDVFSSVSIFAQAGRGPAPGRPNLACLRPHRQW